MKSHKPDADDTAVDRMRLEIVTQFVESVREIVNEEFSLGLFVNVETSVVNFLLG